MMTKIRLRVVQKSHSQLFSCNFVPPSLFLSPHPRQDLSLALMIVQGQSSLFLHLKLWNHLRPLSLSCPPPQASLPRLHVSFVSWPSSWPTPSIQHLFSNWSLGASASSQHNLPCSPSPCNVDCTPQTQS